MMIKSKLLIIAITVFSSAYCFSQGSVLVSSTNVNGASNVEEKRYGVNVGVQENEFIASTELRVKSGIYLEKKKYEDLITEYEKEVDRIKQFEAQKVKDVLESIRLTNTIKTKGEFETTAEYNVRKIQVEKEVKNLVSQYQSFIDASLSSESNLPLIKGTIAEYKRNLVKINEFDEFITNNPVKVLNNIDITSLDYNADDESFVLSSPQYDIKYKFNLEISKAKEFKQNINNVKFIEGYKTLIGFIYNDQVISDIVPMSTHPIVKVLDFTLVSSLDEIFNIPSTKTTPTSVVLISPQEGELNDAFKEYIQTTFISLNESLSRKTKFSVKMNFNKFGSIKVSSVLKLKKIEDIQYTQKILQKIFNECKFTPAKEKGRYIDYSYVINIKS